MSDRNFRMRKSLRDLGNKTIDEFIRTNDRTHSQSAVVKKGRSSRASWQKCQVNRCPYRKSRFVTSFCASKNDASEIRGDSIISDCWSILTLNPNFHKPIHDDPPRKRATAKAHKRHIEVAPVASSPTNPLSMESKPSSSSSSAAKVETTQAADEEAEMQINSRKSRRARRREKFLAYKVSRRNRKWKRCPNAPHNTTSFLMEYHKDEQPFRSDEDAEMDFDFFGNRTYDYYDDSSESGMCDEEKNDDSDGSNNLCSRSGRISRSWKDYLDHDEVVTLVQR